MGKTKAKIKAVIPILLLVIIPVGYILVVSELRVITTPPEELFIGEDAFPKGWVRTHFEIVDREHLSSDFIYMAKTTFSDKSSTVIEEATIFIFCYNSVFKAHEAYDSSIHSLVNINITYMDLGDEGHFESWSNIEGPAIAEYNFRENNIEVGITFSRHRPGATYQPNPYQPWMDEVARLQASMIR